MKFYTKILYFLSFSTILAACSGGEEKNENQADETAQKVCFYSYNPGSTVLEWTAYKFTEKKGVPGTFTEISVEGIQESDDAQALLKGLTLVMKTSSVESQDPDRNKKIYDHFFGTIDAEEITGKIKSMNEDGSAVLTIAMGGVSRDLKGTYTWDNNVFAFQGTMDVGLWNAASGIRALNEICKDLHTGADGKSKLWSTVDIRFETTLKSDCK